VAFLLIVDVVALIFATVGPFKDTFAFHFVVAPHTTVFTAVGPVINTSAFDIVVDKVSRVGALICPGETSVSMFAAFDIGTLI